MARKERPGRTNPLLKALCGTLKEKLPDLERCGGVCRVHDGRFDAAELKRWSTRTPALFVVCLGTVAVEDPGTEQSDSVKQLAIYVLTSDRPGLSRGEAARNLVDALEVLAPRQRWGLTGIGPAEQVRSDNLYSGRLDKQGGALWGGVTWRQTLRLGDSVFDADTGAIPKEIYVSMAPVEGDCPAAPDDLPAFERRAKLLISAKVLDVSISGAAVRVQYSLAGESVDSDWIHWLGFRWVTEGESVLVLLSAEAEGRPSREPLAVLPVWVNRGDGPNGN